MLYLGAIWLGLMLWMFGAVPASSYIIEFVMILFGFLLTPAYVFAAYVKWRHGWLKWIFAVLAVLASAMNFLIAITFIE
jgi:hypothetical protein